MYRELAPPPEIAAHVAWLWTRGPEPAEREHRIVPDACADIVWITDRRLIVAGPSTGPVLSRIPRGGSAVGVRFRVRAGGSALGAPARAPLTRPGAGAGPVLPGALARRRPPAEEIDPVVRAAALGAALPRTTVERLG